MELSEAEIEKLRQSGIRLDADGRFWHQGGEVRHAGLRAALFRWLDRNPDGRYVLRLDERRFVYLEVEDAPFVIASLRWEGERAWVRLSDGTEEELDYPRLRLAPSGVAYCRVKGRFDARVAAGAWGVLQSRLMARDGGVWLDATGGPYRLAKAG